MKIVSYNIHYAIGKDGQYNLDRVIDAIRGADIIALQEVERNYGPPEQPSQPEDIAQRLRKYYWVFDASFDVDGSERRADGSIINRRRQHGQMLLSRWPILSKRYYPLPRLDAGDEFNMQLGSLEAVIETPLGALRIYVVHFGSVSSEERQRQARFVLGRVVKAPSEGGSWTGRADKSADRDWSEGISHAPIPASALVLGDFNLQPDSPEYRIIADAVTDQNLPLLTDIWALLNPGKSVMTWHPNPGRSGDEPSALLDYCFVTQELVSKARSSWVDEEVDGSDHHPVWVEFES